jgi:hypothetical protein
MLIVRDAISNEVTGHFDVSDDQSHYDAGGQWLNTVERNDVTWHDWQRFQRALDKWSNGYVYMERVPSTPFDELAASQLTSVSAGASPWSWMLKSTPRVATQMDAWHHLTCSMHGHSIAEGDVVYTAQHENATHTLCQRAWDRVYRLSMLKQSNS